MSILVADLEANGFKPNKIWVCGVLDYRTGEFDAYTGDNISEGLIRIAEADIVIGHNFRAYDAKVIEELTDGIIKLDDEQIVDTLELGREILPEMKKQSLETWGEILGFPKVVFNEGFDRFHPKMVPYCERDCRLDMRVFDFLMEVQTLV
jgi:hypothetical protein